MDKKLEDRITVYGIGRFHSKRDLSKFNEWSVEVDGDGLSEMLKDNEALNFYRKISEYMTPDFRNYFDEAGEGCNLTTTIALPLNTFSHPDIVYNILLEKFPEIKYIFPESDEK